MTARSFHQRIIAPHLTQEVKKNYIVLFLAFFSLLFFGFWGIRPLLSNISSLRLELKSGRAYEAALTAKIAALDKGKANLAQITTKLKAINGAVPNEPSQAELIEELAVDGGKAGFSFTTITFKEKETENGTSFESFACIFRGSPTGLIHLLGEIEEGRLIEVESLQYKREKTKAREILVVTLGGKSLYYGGGQE